MAIAKHLNWRTKTCSAWVERRFEAKGFYRWQRFDHEAKHHPANGKGQVKRAAGQLKTHDGLKSGDLVDAVLLSERTRRGGWKAQLPNSGLVGSITNSSTVPADAQPNTVIKLRVGATNKQGTHLQFDWPSDSGSPDWDRLNSD